MLQVAWGHRKRERAMVDRRRLWEYYVWVYLFAFVLYCFCTIQESMFIYLQDDYSILVIFSFLSY